MKILSIVADENNDDHEYLANCMSPAFSLSRGLLTVLQPGFTQIPYRIFILRSDSPTAPLALANDLRRAQISLLHRGELASTKNGELWTFSRDSVQSAPVPDESSGLQGNSLPL